MIRNDGNASTVSISRPTRAEPGNGTNASTIAKKVPSTRHPAVEVAAIATVRHNASRKTCEPSTSPHEFPVEDSRNTRSSG